MGNIFQMLLDFGSLLFTLAENLKAFLTTEISVLGINFSVWGLLGSGLIITVLVWAFIKAVV